MDQEIKDQQLSQALAGNCGYGNVKEWLLGMGLGQYYDLFIENGYDSFTVCSKIQRIDIETIGIWNKIHANILIQALTRLNNSKAHSVYHRLSVASPDESDLKSLADELSIPQSPKTEHAQMNGFHPLKLRDDFYKKKPTLAEKRLVRALLIQMNVDLSNSKYHEDSPCLDELAEQMSQQLNLEALCVYDILCLLRGMTLENSAINPIKLPANNISNGDVASVSSPEDVFSETPFSPPLAAPKAHLRPTKPPRSITNSEEKPLKLSNGDSILPVATHVLSSNSAVSVPEPVLPPAYDILHADSFEPQIMADVKSPSKLKPLNKLEDTPAPPPPPSSSSTPPNSLTEEALYIELDGSVGFTENNITQKPKPSSSRIFSSRKTNSKKSQEDLTMKKPPNQPPPPPPPTTSTQVTNNFSANKSKTSKLTKRESKSHIEDLVSNSSTTTTTTSSETKFKKQTSLFKKNIKVKNDGKNRQKKSKDESDLITSLQDSKETQSIKRMSKNLSKSSDNLFAYTSSPEGNEEPTTQKSEQSSKQGKNNNDSMKKRFISHIPDLNPHPTDETEPPPSVHSLPPNPIPRRRNSPEETIVNPTHNSKPQPEFQSLSRQKSENRAQPPKKPKRLISDDSIYDNVVTPNPIPRVRKLDSPPLKKLDLPSVPCPQRSYTVSSRPQSKISSELKLPTGMVKDDSCNNIARIKPDIPKGKKPVLRAKPGEGTQPKRDKLIGEALQRGKDTNTENVITRTQSPLTAPPLPTTKRPCTPSNSNQPPEPPPIHLIPSVRPIAHVRPTKPPIITPPSVRTSSPIAEPRNVDSWKKIEDKIWSILKEEDFLDYLVSHYTRENGESGITPGLVCRLATETSFAIHHIAFALDNIRINKLNELGRSAVPISIIEFDEMELPTQVDTIHIWLTSIGLPNYIKSFCENIKDPHEIKNLDADELSEFCIDTKHRGCLFHAIDLLQ